jgi:hypothetical protein
LAGIWLRILSNLEVILCKYWCRTTVVQLRWSSRSRSKKNWGKAQISTFFTRFT